jgi:membrane protein YqaA with SNARE-associated domain
MLYKFFTVAGLATFEIYAAIPAGFAFKMPPLYIFLASVTGGVAGVYVATYLGDYLRKIFYKKKNSTKPEKPKTGIVYRIWDRFGVIGLGLLGTIIVGAPISIGVGVGFNVPLKKMLAWCLLGVVIRCALYTTIGHYGLKMVL